MISEQIRGIANHIVVGLQIDNKIIRLLYPLADEIDKLEDDLERAEGERVIFGDRVIQLKIENNHLNAVLDRIDIETKEMERKLDVFLSRGGKS